MEITERVVHGVTFQRADEISYPHGFSTRLGGVSEGIFKSMNLGTTRGDEPCRVRENYRRFCAAVGTDPDRIVMTNQVHSARVREVTEADVKGDLYDPEGYEVDGLVTDVPGLCLVVFAADCLPILLCDQVRGVAAAVHSGWRGTAQGIAAAAVERMVNRYGCRPEHILAAIGPGIDTCCFETHADVPQAMLAAFGEGVGACIHPMAGDKFHVDNKGINRYILEQSGLLPQHIAVSHDCTSCLPHKYWSHRVTQGKRGSMVGMIAIG